MRYKHVFSAAAALLLSLSVVISAHADEHGVNPEPMWPGAEYNSSIPTMKQILGYHPGERISNHSQMVKYFKALEQAAPDRIKLFDYAQSWEGRELIYAVVGAPEHVSQLREFASNMQKLADPRTTDKSEAKKLIESMPASVWLGYGVHGNEISSTDAAMVTAYHLLAAPEHPVNKTILSNTLVFIDPLQNPDGRTRFTSRYYATVGLEPSADRISAEHNEPWPNGRTNHYLFDMNRDWLAITQPETAGRIAVMNTFKPLVVIDLHEMGGDESYYFAPAAKPINPHMTKRQVQNMSDIGRNHGKHFDQMGFDYFTREIFDAFYPGYGDSWPTFYGASASTYEVGSSRGEVFRKKNGELYTYRDSVQQHVVASISTAEAVANMRKTLLNDFYQYQVSAIEAGKKNDSRYYIMPNQRDRAANHRLATLMAQHGVEVKQATESFKACGKSYQPGAFLIDTAQPKGRFVTTTFSEQVNMSDAFIKEQERRRARNLHDEIYDVTGWSLPLMFNVDTDTCGKSIRVATAPVSPDMKLEAKLTNMNATVAYLVPWGDLAAVKFLTTALRQGLVVKSADKAFELDGNKQYPAGTLIVERRRNGDDVADKVKAIAEQTGAVVEGVNTAWVTDGPSFGSNSAPELVKPNIAIAWDAPLRTTSAGNTRFVIERQMGYPVTAIRADDLASVDLSRYHVLILPHGWYGSTPGEAGAENLKKWVRNGGVLVTMAGGTRFAADAEAGLLDVDREYAVTESDDASGNDDGNMVPGKLLTEASQLNDEIQSADTSPDWVAGVLANVEVDQEHWLTAGVNPDVVGLVYGNDIYTPIKLKSGKNLAWFKGPDEVLASGYLWEENRKQLAYKPFLIHQSMGDGMVIAFTQEPTFRAYMDGLNVMFANALFRSPAHTERLQ